MSSRIAHASALITARTSTVRRPARILGIVVAVRATACRTAPVYEVHAAPISVSNRATIEEIENVIWQAGRSLGWEMNPTSPGTMIGTIRVKRHVAVALIRFDQRSLSIEYRSSENLSYGDGRIHRRYNRWIHNLEARIRSNLRSRLSTDEHEHSSPGAP